jgi:ribosome maturation factor RimP
MAKADLSTAARPICQRLADEMGYELVDVALEKEPAGKYLRIYLDTPQGINLNDCEAFHRRVQPLVDHLEYDFLEVCSPGLDRPIKAPEDFERATGETVEVRLFKPQEGKKIFEGTLAGLQDGQVLLDAVDGRREFPQKAVALVKRVISLEGIEDADLGEEE